MVICLGARSQSTENIAIRVINNQNQPLANANIELLKPDSSLIKLAVSDSAGLVTFFNLAPANFLIRSSLVGFASSVTKITSGKNEYHITLLPSNNTLQAVTVSTKKPFIELRPDMTVINMDAGIANVGTTALEALEKLPGITIDKDGNISLKGRSGVMVMLDGKPSYLSGA